MRENLLPEVSLPNIKCATEEALTVTLPVFGGLGLVQFQNERSWWIQPRQSVKLKRSTGPDLMRRIASHEFWIRHSMSLGKEHLYLLILGHLFPR